MKLKTLEDLKHIPTWDIKTPADKYTTIKSKDLQEVAREWIKELENNAYADRNERYTELYSDGRRYCTSVINWIEDFFNLEETE